jgi:Ran GTPase-activating protein (RanGAP) involved in mRNA processing and transport
MSKNCLQGAEAGKALGDALAGNTVLKELDLSGAQYSPNMDIKFVKAFIPGLSNNGALLVLSLESNRLYADGGKALAEGLKGNQVIQELNIASNYVGITSSGDTDMSGVTALADVIPDMGAMKKIDIGSNRLCAEGTKLLVAALKGNEIMTELNISSNDMICGSMGDMSGVIALADVISEMGAMSVFTFSGDGTYWKPVTMKTTMTEADFSGKDLGTSGALMLSAFLPKCT